MGRIRTSGREASSEPVLPVLEQVVDRSGDASKGVPPFSMRDVKSDVNQIKWTPVDDGRGIELSVKLNATIDFKLRVEYNLGDGGAY